MSLILLTDAAEPFVARDLAGRALPGATLDFYRSGTTEPAHELVDDGHFEADGDGEFDTIELEPATSYRVVHKTAEGALIYDVDPYVCTCGETDPVFRSPINRVLDGDGRIAPGATLTSLDGADDPLPLYADPELTTPLPNPLTANAAGFFVPIYGDDDIEYTIVLRDAAGNVIEEWDPYVCACGVPAVVGDYVFTAGTDFGLTGYLPGFFGTLDSVSDELAAVLAGGTLGLYTAATMNLVASSGGVLTALAASYSSFTILETSETWPIPGTPGSGAEWVYADPTPLVNGNTYNLVFNP